MAAPPGYPYVSVPMPYMPAVLVKPETVSGIRTYQIGLVLDIVFGVFALIIGLAAVLTPVGDPNAAFNLAAMIGASACGLMIVFVINFIVSLMSVMKMHQGADEYGPEHAKYASRGVLFKWAGTALSTMAVILIVYLLLFGTFQIATGGRVQPTAFVPLLVTIFWTAGVTCKGQMYRHMVRALQPPEVRVRSDLASILIPCLGIAGIAVIGFVTIRLVALLQNPSSVGPAEAAQITQILIGGTFLPPGFALVGYIMFLSVYLRTSDRLSRGLAQVHATMPMMPMWPAYAAPAPAPMAPAPPPPPPPSPTATVPATPPAAQGSPCPRCGQPVPSEAVFCMNCGARVKT